MAGTGEPDAPFPRSCAARSAPCDAPRGGGGGCARASSTSCTGGDVFCCARAPKHAHRGIVSANQNQNQAGVFGGNSVLETPPQKPGTAVSDRVSKTVGGAHKAGVDASGRQYHFSSSRRIHSTGNSGAHVSLVLGSRARRAEPRCGRANLGRRWRSGARGAEKKGSAVPLPVLASRGGDAQSLGAHGRSL